jgi:hypothetical protein
MDVGIIPGLIQQFVSQNQSIIGPVTFTVTPPMDAAMFPDELYKLGAKVNGLSLLWAKADFHVVYVGISGDIPSRIYQHIGPGFSWTRGGNTAHFPHCTLASDRPWLSLTTQAILRAAAFKITAVLPEPPTVSRLLEAFLIYWGDQHQCKPEINVL